MKTGEGKTLVATLPVYLNALAGRGVHVVTVNDYLARRDAEWMGRIYGFLGLSRRRHRARPDARPAAAGLRGRRHLRHEQRVRLRLSARQHGVQPRSRWCSAGTTYAIVDEVDSILVDEARTPLIISGPTEDRSELYVTIDKLIPQLGAGRFRARREGALRDLHRGRHGEGRGASCGRPGSCTGETLYDVENVAIVHHLNNALRAHKLFQRDKDYIVKNGQVDHHRRVHRPHDGGPALFGRPAPGAGGEGARQDPAGEPDARLDHLPELFPPLREARRHDRHGRHRGGRVHEHLQPRRGRGADQRADDRASTRTTRSTGRWRRSTRRSSS